MAPLEQYYRGDEDWKSFVSVFERHWAEAPPREASALLAELGSEDLAKVVYATFPNETHRLNWLDKAIPALDGLTPRECLQSQNGIRRLRVALTRMPR